WIETLTQHELDPIFLVAPTTSDERLTLIAREARGFIYAVSRAGVTGTRSEMTREAETLVQRVRSVSDLPIAVGFGVSTPAEARLPESQRERSIALFQHGTLTVKLYAPRGSDPQTPHTRDEIYVVIRGSGDFIYAGERRKFGPHDFLFVPAGMEHRFENFSDD